MNGRLLKLPNSPIKGVLSSSFRTVGAHSKQHRSLRVSYLFHNSRFPAPPSPARLLLRPPTSRVGEERLHHGIRTRQNCDLPPGAASLPDTWAQSETLGASECIPGISCGPLASSKGFELWAPVLKGVITGVKGVRVRIRGPY